MKFLKRVAQWNATAKRPQLNSPGTPAEDIWKLRIKLLREEIDELEAAYANEDVVESLDAMCDIQVVLNGAIAEAGFMQVFDLAMTEVCNSNDSKFLPDGTALLREGDNKIIKGPNYRKPDLVAILWSNTMISTATALATEEENLVTALEDCDFTCNGGPLRNFTGWQRLKELICR